MRYLNRDYWEQKEKEKSDQAATYRSEQQHSQRQLGQTALANQEPDMTTDPTTNKMVMNNMMGMPLQQQPISSKNDEELDEFVMTLKTQVEIFVNRMKSNSSRGRSIANDSSVQTLFMNTMAMHSQLLKHIQEQEDKRVHFEGLQDKLTQVSRLLMDFLFAFCYLIAEILCMICLLRCSVFSRYLSQNT